jgi:uncharacterized membrane protein YqjE
VTAGEEAGTAFEEAEAQDAGAQDRALGQLVFEIAEKVATLVREEIELAKAEVSEKVTKLLRGAVAGLVAGAFAFLALILLMHGVAWLIDDLLFDNRFWPGFLVEAGLFALLAAGGGLYAWRAFKTSALPTPDMAIAEAREFRSALKGEEE